MRKTKELKAFEALVHDPDEHTKKVRVVFLDSKLLKMADEFKSKRPNRANSHRHKKVPLRSTFLRR